MYFCLIVFPSCFDKWSYVEELIENKLKVIDKKKIKLTNDEKFTLISLLYSNESWLGNKDNNWEGIYYKMNSCFPSSNSMINIFYVYARIDTIKQVKTEIRNYCNCGNHSIHSTDEEEKTLEIKLKYLKI